MRPATLGKLGRLEEQRLIRALQKGDREAARLLIEHHKQRLFAFVWRVLPNHDEAEDVCQEAFLKAVSSIDSFDPTYRFSTWLFTIAYRLSLNGLRQRKKCASGDLDFNTFADATEPAPERTAESHEAAALRDAVWRAVERLSDPQRVAITLFYREDLSCQDIAEVLDVPVATVKSHLHRARMRLKALLEPLFAGDSQNLRILSEAIA